MSWIENTLAELQDEINDSTEPVETDKLTKKYNTLTRNKTFWENIETDGIADPETLQELYNNDNLTYEGLCNNISSYVDFLETEYDSIEHDSRKYTRNCLAEKIKFHRNLLCRLEEMDYIE